MKKWNTVQRGSKFESSRRLPKIQIAGKTYFVDEKLQQMRNIWNPHDSIDFDDEYELPVLLDIYEKYWHLS